MCDIGPALIEALRSPVAGPPLAELLAGKQHVTVVVSDETRLEPRRAFLDAIGQFLGDRRLTIAIATGTHGPSRLEDLGIPGWLGRADQVVNHDGHSERDMVVVGHSQRGTTFRVHRCTVETDLVILTGCIKPHYFAGFGAGSKALFPGLGASREIRHNHTLKTEAGSVAGRLDGNPCRQDLEEILDGELPPIFLLNAIKDPEDGLQGAVAGEPRAALRRGAERARPWFRIRCPRARTIVVSDREPISSSLYQASKSVAAVASLLEKGGTIVIAAQCRDGVGPVETVNRAIYEIGIKPRLPREHRIVLVSELDRATVSQTYCEYQPSVEAALDGEPALFLPRASSALVEVEG
ncbi:MAG: DUF2088 domain-containing protein [Deltaproteobacteria bacterium]|nr:DUF2088 domain-containing protein [Deltaproteobacteria bacterium]